LDAAEGFDRIEETVRSLVGGGEVEERPRRDVRRERGTSFLVASIADPQERLELLARGGDIPHLEVGVPDAEIDLVLALRRNKDAPRSRVVLERRRVIVLDDLPRKNRRGIVDLATLVGRIGDLEIERDEPREILAAAKERETVAVDLARAAELARRLERAREEKPRRHRPRWLGIGGEELRAHLGRLILFARQEVRARLKESRLLAGARLGSLVAKPSKQPDRACPIAVRESVARGPEGIGGPRVLLRLIRPGLFHRLRAKERHGKRETGDEDEEASPWEGQRREYESISCHGALAGCTFAAEARRKANVAMVFGRTLEEDGPRREALAARG